MPYFNDVKFICKFLIFAHRFIENNFCFTYQSVKRILWTISHWPWPSYQVWLRVWEWTWSPTSSYWWCRSSAGWVTRMRRSGWWPPLVSLHWFGWCHSRLVCNLHTLNISNTLNYQFKFIGIFWNTLYKLKPIIWEFSVLHILDSNSTQSWQTIKYLLPDLWIISPRLAHLFNNILVHVSSNPSLNLPWKISCGLWKSFITSLMLMVIKRVGGCKAFEQRKDELKWLKNEVC